MKVSFCSRQAALRALSGHIREASPRADAGTTSTASPAEGRSEWNEKLDKLLHHNFELLNNGQWARLGSLADF
jgi:hypothetical protein